MMKTLKSLLNERPFRLYREIDIDDDAEDNLEDLEDLEDLGDSEDGDSEMGDFGGFGGEGEDLSDDDSDSFEGDDFSGDLDDDIDIRSSDDEDDLASDMDDDSDSVFGSDEGEEQEEEQQEDPDYQGVIRTVRGAYLVYKRQNASGTFGELWIYNIDKDMKKASELRRAILSGTDINPGTENSPDGSQRVKTTSIGNVQFLEITGLPN